MRGGRMLYESADELDGDDEDRSGGNEQWMSSWDEEDRVGPAGHTAINHPKFMPQSKRETHNQSLNTKSKEHCDSLPRQPAPANRSCIVSRTRCIVSIDADCFYAQCEEIRTPSLKGKPIGVQQKMLVITSNYSARESGIKKGDSLKEVRRKCPSITICNGENLTFYREISQKFFDCVVASVKNMTAGSSTFGAVPVERLGMDELFVDITALVDIRLDHTTIADVDMCGIVYGSEQDVGNTSDICNLGDNGEGNTEPTERALIHVSCNTKAQSLCQVNYLKHLVIQIA
eukprot:m.437918 g.437918  ORF g.437918 m.437918 type:complete len:288 (+) comp21440_c0_seq5:123-986(+)